MPNPVHTWHRPSCGIEGSVLRISTYEELHSFVEQLVKILETVFELGIMKRTPRRYKMARRAPDDDEN